MTPSRFWLATEWACKSVRSIIRGSGAPVLPGPLDDGDLLARMEEEQEVWPGRGCGNDVREGAEQSSGAIRQSPSRDQEPPWWSRCAVEAKAAKTEQGQFVTTDTNGVVTTPGPYQGIKLYLPELPYEYKPFVSGHLKTPADVAGATSDPADRGTPPRGAEEAPRGADSTFVHDARVVELTPAANKAVADWVRASLRHGKADADLVRGFQRLIAVSDRAK